MRHRAHAARVGFTLIEVLIAIVVLSLGLLGLAAVFPVVVYQQREASGTVQGISVERSVGAWITGHLQLNQRSLLGTDLTIINNRQGWEMLFAEPTFSTNGEWVLPRAQTNVLMQGVSTGSITLGQGPNRVAIPVSQRLFPSPYASASGVPQAGDEPRFVWDLCARRIPQGDASVYDDAVQIAVFVRRVDASIRLAQGVSLSAALMGNVQQASQRRVPVAEDGDGRPTNDGYGPFAQATYSMVSSFTFEEPAGDLSVIRPISAGAFANLRPFASQVGQRFVDPDGVVHRVVELIPETNPTLPPLLRLSPAFTSRQLEQWRNTAQGRRLLFTPQPPVAVEVMTVGRQRG